MKLDHYIRLTDPFGNKLYLYGGNGKGWNLKGAGETPLALSNIASNASELRFHLERCKTAAEAMKVLPTYVPAHYKPEVMKA